ncbi:MAG: MFS transporter [Haloarculaceae archaeon]
MATVPEFGPDLGVDRRVVVLALARMADAVGNSFLIVVLPLYIASGYVTGGAMGLGESLVTGVVLSMFGLLNSVCQPFVGRFSDRVGKRRVFVVAGLLVLAVTNAVYSFAHTFPALILIRAIQGIGVAFTITATIALVNELSTSTSRGGSMGLFNTFRLVGFGAGPVAAGAVVHRGPYLGGTLTGFDAAFYLAALSAVVSTVLVILFVRDPERVESSAGEDLSVAIRDESGDHLLDPVFTLGVASLFMAIGIALLSAIEPQVNQRLSQSATMFGVEFGAFVLAQVLFQLPVGRLSDTYGRRPFILVGLVFLVPTVLVQGFVATPLQMVLARFLQGAAAAMVFAPSLALAGDLARVGESGTKLSVLTMAFGLGTALGPLSSGFLVRYGFAVPFVFGAVIAVAGFVLVYTQVEETLPDAGSGPGPSAADAGN